MPRSRCSTEPRQSPTGRNTLTTGTRTNTLHHSTAATGNLMAININLELTDHCNIRCKMCSQSMRSDAHGAPKKFMTWETWQQSLRNLDGFPEPVHLCPHWLGEPTIHPRFDLFIEYAFAINQHNRLFEKFKLHTNAVQFSQDRGRLLLQLSLPHINPNTFNFVHFSIDAFLEMYIKRSRVETVESGSIKIFGFPSPTLSIATRIPKGDLGFRCAA